jgi:hypothetical protein
MPNNNSDIKNDWTLMFFFASDNPLAPLLVSQLKAIKDAGFQEHTEVLVYFDPMEKGCPTKIYNVNCRRKASALALSKKDNEYPRSLIGDDKDSYIRKMDGDEVNSKNFSDAMQKAMKYPSSAKAHEMLGHFVDYALDHHEATNYMLILVGHGMIVGRDMFLPDEDPISAITLLQLQDIMKKFKKPEGTSLQLLALHSCSMSSIEVAYQLKGTAKYVMAHQGPAFANSWPYRQFVKKVFNTIEQKKRSARKAGAVPGVDAAALEKLVSEKQVDVQRLVEKLYYHCLHNATDFLSAGYSADIALCSLEEDKLSSIEEPLKALVRALKKNLYQNSVIMDLILLAHWEAQSFWDENYTDLYDFCLCLMKKCQAMRSNLANANVTAGQVVSDLGEVATACSEVIEVLSVSQSAKRSDRFNSLVIHADNFGTRHHYARGLSVYFPWCEPLDDDGPTPPVQESDKSRQDTKGRHQKITERYMSYDFNTRFGIDSWWSFLESYFRETKRKSRYADLEHASVNKRLAMRFARDNDVRRKTATYDFNVDGSLSHRTPEVGTRTPETGTPCTCPTIKNYPTTFDEKYPPRRVKKFSITPGALRAFRAAKLDSPEEDPVDDGTNQ